MKTRFDLCYPLLLILGALTIGCDQKETRDLPGYEKLRIQRQQLEGRIVSKILESDDSTFYPKVRHSWKIQERKDGPIGFSIVSTRDSSSKHIYLAISDKYFPPPLGDSGFLSVTFLNHSLDESLLRRYLANRDTTRFELPLKIKHRYVFVRNEDYNKPHLSLEKLPKKYVGNFCRIRISRPTFDDEISASLTYYENECSGKRAVFFTRLESGEWKVMAKADLGSPNIPIP